MSRRRRNDTIDFQVWRPVHASEGSVVELYQLVGVNSLDLLAGSDDVQTRTLDVEEDGFIIVQPGDVVGLRTGDWWWRVRFHELEDEDVHAVVAYYTTVTPSLTESGSTSTIIYHEDLYSLYKTVHSAPLITVHVTVSSSIGMLGESTSLHMHLKTFFF